MNVNAFSTFYKTFYNNNILVDELFCELFVISSRTVSSSAGEYEYGISQLHIFFHLLSTSE